ncbi:signal peptide peptidase SppA [Nocardioides sp. ChNu-153]|uniref:signal peptide peptidase SppA n=1 Tax=Nocardioides sp. ChNu-153 TaxID=2779364 RepID=UPI0026538193|nr:signal peptide peptidase SppA [Nocardioides sp. ChNu-153]MDN7120973.1 signal peptide peptidase SppA [Nocardioides sp. ChNu-153]
MAPVRLPDVVRPYLEPLLGPLGSAGGPALARLRRVRGTERLLLELDLTRGLLEAPPTSPVAALRSLQTPTLRGLVTALGKAAEDDVVVGLVAHLGGDLGLSAGDELRAAVTGFRASGKRAVAWAETYGEMVGGNAAYHLASAFEEVWVQPTGQVGLVGAHAEVVFLRGALDKLGVTTQLGQRHEYKSAANTFLERGMTDPHREMMTRIVDSVTETLVADVARGRGLPVTDVRAALEAGPLTPEDALARRLVDRIGYREDVYAAVRASLTDGDVDADGPVLRFVERYAKPGGPLGGLKDQLPSGRGKGVVAVVGAYGPIHLGRNGGPNPMSGPSIGSDSLATALRTAGNDPDVRAVVLRIDSPGGSAVASDAVRRAVLQVRSEGTPVVASMGAVAGSGGYFIAMPCDEIVAGAITLTGSIGVLGGKQVLSDTLARIGVERETVRAGRFSDMFSTDRPFDEEEWARVEGWLDAIYDDFTTKAAQDRGMAVADLERVARGRVWTGADAAERGLVDRLGGLAHAVDRACGLAGTTRRDVDVRAWPKPNPFAALTPPESSEAPAAAYLTGPPAPSVAAALLGQAGEGVGAVDQVLRLLVTHAGLPAYGALTMPGRITLR